MIETKISIIVPVYNVAQYLEQCLDSLVGQTLKDIEIICINDGSTDKSLKTLKKYAKKYDVIKVIDIENNGVSNARNIGLKNSNGKYIMFVDSDDWVDSNTCKVLLEAAEKEDADCVMCSYTKEFKDRSVVNHIFEKKYFIWDKDEIKQKFHRRLFGLVGEELKCPEDADIIVSPCMQLFRTEICRKIQFVDLKVIGTFEDGLYQIMVYENCEKFVYTDEPFYHYRKTNEQSLTTKYVSDKFEKWQNLFNIMQCIIEEKNYGAIYNEALYNRIALSMIALGINEISAKEKAFLAKSKRLKQILKTERYEKAYKQLEIKYMPFQWKVFFLLCKHKMTFLLVLMLQCIEFLRKRVK